MESTVGQGSTFFFTVRVARGQSRVSRPTQGPRTQITGPLAALFKGGGGIFSGMADNTSSIMAAFSKSLGILWKKLTNTSVHTGKFSTV